MSTTLYGYLYILNIDISTVRFVQSVFICVMCLCLFIRMCMCPCIRARVCVCACVCMFMCFFYVYVSARFFLVRVLGSVDACVQYMCFHSFLVLALTVGSLKDSLSHKWMDTVNLLW